MRAFRDRPRTAGTGLVAVGCAAALLAGCSSGGGTESGDGTAGATGAGGATATATATATVTETATQQPESTADALSAPDGETGAAGEAGDDTCADAPVENPLTGDRPIPVRFADSAGADGTESTGVNFYYGVGDDELDPCAPLSWVTLQGHSGTSELGAPTGSMRETVALFADGQLVTDPAPILARHIDSVERLDDRTVRVNYAFYTDAPAAADESEPGSAVFRWTGGQDGTGGTVEVTENTLPVSQNDRAETLDLGGM